MDPFGDQMVSYDILDSLEQSDYYEDLFKISEECGREQEWRDKNCLNFTNCDALEWRDRDCLNFTNCDTLEWTDKNVNFTNYDASSTLPDNIMEGDDEENHRHCTDPAPLLTTNNSTQELPLSFKEEEENNQTISKSFRDTYDPFLFEAARHSMLSSTLNVFRNTITEPTCEISEALLHPPRFLTNLSQNKNDEKILKNEPSKRHYDCNLMLSSEDESGDSNTLELLDSEYEMNPSLELRSDHHDHTYSSSNPSPYVSTTDSYSSSQSAASRRMNQINIRGTKRKRSSYSTKENNTPKNDTDVDVESYADTPLLQKRPRGRPRKSATQTSQSAASGPARRRPAATTARARGNNRAQDDSPEALEKKRMHNEMERDRRQDMAARLHHLMMQCVPDVFNDPRAKLAKRVILEQSRNYVLRLTEEINQHQAKKAAMEKQVAQRKARIEVLKTEINVPARKISTSMRHGAESRDRSPPS